MGEAGQRLELLLRVLVHDPMGAADGLQRFLQSLANDAVPLKQVAGRPLLRRQPKQHVLGGDVGVAQAAGRFLRLVQRAPQAAGETGVGTAGDAGGAGQFGFRGSGDFLRRRLHLAQHRRDDAALLLQQRLQQVEAADFRVLPATGFGGGHLQGLGGLYGESVWGQHLWAFSL